MENKTLLQKIRSVKYCLMAHPHNEPDSEFADRIDDLQEIEDSLAEHQARQQPVRKTLDECKDEVARKHEAISELDLIGSLIMSRNPEAIQDYVSEVATLYAQAKAVEPQEGWVDVKTLPKHDQHILFVPFPIGSGVRQGCFLEKDEWGRPNMFYGGLGYFEAYKIQCWMPLPEPPTQTNN